MTVTFENLPQAVSELHTKIDKLLHEKAEQKEADYLLTVPQLMDYLPDHPAAPTVYGWVRNNLIPYYKVGKKLFFKKGEIDAWLDAGRNKTDEELASEAIDYINGRRTR